MGGEAVSMRSIDVRNVIAKSKEIEGIQGAQNRVATTGQQAFESELSKRAEEKSGRVQSTPETQYEKIRSDDKGQGDRAEKGGDERIGPNDAVDRKDTDDDSPGDLSVLPGQIIDVEV